jgi:hypothetical protein
MARIGRDGEGRPVILGSGGLPPLDELPDPSTISTNGKPSAKTKAKQTVTMDRFGTLNAFVDCSMAGLSRSELATWLVLYRDTRNGTACTSQADIARRAGLSVRAVKNAVRKLRASGLLVVVFSGGLNRGPSRYRVEPLQKRATRTTGERHFLSTGAKKRAGLGNYASPIP